jgi:hypothetical protein
MLVNSQALFIFLTILTAFLQGFVRRLIKFNLARRIQCYQTPVGADHVPQTGINFLPDLLAYFTLPEI